MTLPQRFSHAFGKTSMARRDALYGYLFIMPQMLGFLVLVLGLLVAVFVFSTQDRSLLQPKVEFVGLANYERLLTKDPLFWQVLGNTLIFAAGLVPLNVVLALVLALIVAQKLRGIVFFRTLYFVPVVTSAVAWAIVWRFLLQGERGTINQLLSMVGIDGANWLRDPGWAMFWVIFTRTIKGVGINMIIFLAAIMDLPRRVVRRGRRRRRQRLAAPAPYHAAIAGAHDSVGDAASHDRIAQSLRHHLPHDRRRSCQRHTGSRELHLLGWLQVL